MLPAISVPFLLFLLHPTPSPAGGPSCRPPPLGASRPAAGGIAVVWSGRVMAGYGDRRSPPFEGIAADGGGRAQSPGAGAGRLPPPPGGFARGLMKQPSRLASGVRQFASRVSMKVPEGVAGMRPGRMTRMQSSAQVGLRSLRFLDKTSGGKEGWKAVERRFDEMTKGSGRLQKENFGKCIGEYRTTDRSSWPLFVGWVGHALAEWVV
jgi:hypothetical protein